MSLRPLPALIRHAKPDDIAGIWETFHSVVAGGDTYTYAPDTTEEEFGHLWLGNPVHTYVAEYDKRIVGTYILRPNQPGLGSHVANAGYMVHPKYQGRGLGRALCEHSIAEARRLGFLAMQFNLVVGTNRAAVSLWQTCGFRIVGTLPKAFRHSQFGFVDAYVMHRFL
jgi:GNAT superfamily N-acetyltransferase